MKTSCLVGLIMVQSLLITAQTDWVQYRTNAQLSLGTNLFSGDVCAGCPNVGSSAGLSSRFWIAGKAFFRPEVQYNWFRASKDQNSLSFSNHTFGANLAFEYGLHHLSPASFSKRAKTELFIIGQLGVLHHQPTARILGEPTRLAPLQTEGQSYSRLVPVIGSGLNLNFKTASHTWVGIQLEVNYLFSDYLDDVSGVYIFSADFDDIRKEAVDPSQSASVGAQRGTKTGNDLFYRLMITYSINTSSKVKRETTESLD